MKNYDERMESIRNKSEKLRRSKRRKAVIAVSCASMFVLALALTLFVPYSTALPDVSMYKDSPYYPVIQQLNAYNYEPPEYKNRYEALMDQLQSWADKDGAEATVSGTPWMNATVAADNWADQEQIPEMDFMGGMAPPTADAPNDEPNPPVGDSGNYEEVTDNQVEGVIEADIFKRTNTHIFHLYCDILNVYTIEGEDSQLVGSYDIQWLLQEAAENCYLGDPQMYLSQDGKTLTLLLRYDSKTDCGTVLLDLDVSNPEKVQEAARVFFPGNYISSRMVDDELLLFYTCSFGTDVNYDDPSTYVPQYGWVDDLKCIDGEDIIVPDVMTETNYTVVCKLDGKTLELIDCKALLSCASDVYVSQEHIYFANPYWKIMEKTDEKITTREVTQITGISYTGEALAQIGSIQVEGAIKDQYSMDEFDGMLRVVTSTVNDRTESNRNPYDVQPDIWWESGQKSVNLYCIDLENWSVAGMVESFAPEGEEATSVRFEGSTAYVCTAELIQLKDPVYFFDLSDPKNITWTDTGIIGGYSSSLVNFGENTLLGIGYDENRNLKIEVYREAGEKVESIACYTRECYFSEDYKCYYIDRENGLIGLPIWDYSDNVLAYIGDTYLIVQFDGNSLIPVLETSIGSLDDARADRIDGWFYILSNTLTVQKLWTERMQLEGTVVDISGGGQIYYCTFITEDGTSYFFQLQNCCMTTENAVRYAVGDRIRVYYDYDGELYQHDGSYKVPGIWHLEILED